jgi:hypothetical protein
MKPILNSLGANINFNSICYIEDWMTEEKGEYYFFKEILSENLIRNLNVIKKIYKEKLNILTIK